MRKKVHKKDLIGKRPVRYRLVSFILRVKIKKKGYKGPEQYNTITHKSKYQSTNTSRGNKKIIDLTVFNLTHLSSAIHTNNNIFRYIHELK